MSACWCTSTNDGSWEGVTKRDHDLLEAVSSALRETSDLQTTYLNFKRLKYVPTTPMTGIDNTQNVASIRYFPS